MEFCKKCGAVLMQKGENSCCPRCNYSTKGKVCLKTSEKIEKKEEIAVVTSKVDVRPITSEKCKKCKNDQCYFWAIQTRGSDEAETRFFQCTKCGNTHKLYR